MRRPPPRLRVQPITPPGAFLKLISGKPEATQPADAAREMFAATILASRGALHVDVGPAAVARIWSGRKPASEPDCDVIAEFREGFVLAEGKGAKDVHKAIVQFASVATHLHAAGKTVVSGLIVVPPDLPFGYFDGEQWRHRDPAKAAVFGARLEALATMQPPANPSYCMLLEEGFRISPHLPLPACGFVPSSARYTLYTHAQAGRWASPRPFTFGPTNATVEIVLAAFAE